MHRLGWAAPLLLLAAAKRNPNTRNFFQLFDKNRDGVLSGSETK